MESAFGNNEVTGYVKAAGSKLMNGEGRELLLRGVGLGSWFLPEGYMWRFPEQGDRPRRIERMVEELIGPAKAERFWETYYDRYINEDDIRRIAEEGFNSVRIPINARAFIEDGEPLRFKEANLKRLDRAIGWCETHKLYVILDLHGAPGGQTGANIDDSENDKPELFASDAYRRLTVELWRRLAERYKDEWIVAAYDLLNEPLPDWNKALNKELMPLYRDIAKAIREADDRHMITLEGAHWATDWSVFDKRIDDNVLLQFHKYWNNPDTESIRKYLDKREEWNVPVFMGEGGENNTDWYAGAFRLFEDHGISWNFWTWKKMDTANSPCSIRRPEGWERLAAYLQGGEKPEAEEAETILQAYLDNLPLERCDYNAEVVRSLFRRAPLRIPAVFYGYRGEGVSFGVGSKAERHVGFRATDGTDIRFADSSRTEANFRHGGGQAWKPEDVLCLHAAPGDWFDYEFTVGIPGKDAATAAEAAYSIVVRASAASPETGRVSVAVNGREIGHAAFEGAEWSEAKAGEAVTLPPGLHRLTVRAEGAPVRLERIGIV